MNMQWSNAVSLIQHTDVHFMSKTVMSLCTKPLPSIHNMLFQNLLNVFNRWLPFQFGRRYWSHRKFIILSFKL
jgi:hypothetical protein